MALEATELEDINSTITLTANGEIFEHELRLRVAAVVDSFPVDIDTTNSAAQSLARYALKDLVHIIIHDRVPHESLRFFRLLIDAVCDRAILEGKWTTSGAWAISTIDDHLEDIDDDDTTSLPEAFLGSYLSSACQVVQCTTTRVLDHFSKDMWNFNVLDFCTCLMDSMELADVLGKSLIHQIVLKMLKSKEMSSTRNFATLLAFLSQAWECGEEWGGAGQKGVIRELKRMKSNYQQHEQQMVSGLLKIWEAFLKPTQNIPNKEAFGGWHKTDKWAEFWKEMKDSNITKKP
ncbi:hypothetical protein K491DRAFT_682759 [Lophiostoma macrostomum CBS 122681]|uniref:Uncharacterized protein n=1 Tax=Lophiostoma macrostomum CBS 122681 TaxID=1314788 RepID=A0A6A6SVU3_9PLEO|nr:hypothetical protein K491DRAFT_682759 [Lophiostoma macrostomum CBS 122681]